MTLLRLFAIILLLPACLLADPGVTDTLRIDSVTAYPGRSVQLPVYIFNDEQLDAIETVFKYDSNFFSIDTFSIGSGYSFLDEGYFVMTDNSGEVAVVRIPFSDIIPESNDILYYLHVSVDPDTPPGTYTFDTTSWVYAANRFVTPDYMFIYPEFIPGKITVLESPTYLDSIWVDDVTGQPGETIELNIYGFNEKPLDTIQLALGFESNNISFKDVIFTDTRGDLAMTKTFNANNSLGQFLVTLVYNQASPLSIGEGVLAKVRFDIDPLANSETIVIDSISYLDSQPLELSVIASEGDETFTPFFTSGTITIDKATSIGDDNRGYLPIDFDLKQNHPNPFNPSTIIEFDMPKAGNVIIHIFNILGQNIKTLTNRHYTAGTHQITFNGKDERNNNLASGVYFYRLDTEGFSQTRKMTLIK